MTLTALALFCYGILSIATVGSTTNLIAKREWTPLACRSHLAFLILVSLLTLFVILPRS